MVDWGVITGVASIVLYFGALLFALASVGRQIFESYYRLLQTDAIEPSNKRKAILGATALLALAAAAGISTWYYIIRFFVWTFVEQAGSDWRTWIIHSDLFVQAYRMVSKSPLHWFWSSQLLIFTCGFVSMLKCTGGRRPWTFALLGFLGAISVATALFLADWLCRNTTAQKSTQQTSTSDQQAVGPVLGFSILLALASITANTLLDITTYTYVFNLIFLHVILLVALLPEPGRTRMRQVPVTLWLRGLARFSLLYGLLQLLRIFRSNAHAGASGIAQNLIDVIFENVCQASITLDLWFALGAVLVFSLFAWSNWRGRVHSQMAKAAP